jgi:two-component system response regulator AtoC
MPSGSESHKTDPGEFPPAEVLFGRSAAMAQVRTRAEKVCATTVQVLLRGDGGTGKEALARWIHANSAVRNGSFVSVNCAAIPGGLLESELFGYEAGAFTGARTAKPGRVEVATNGTLFLDEISEVEAGLQSKLLRFLQDGSYSRIGDVVERTTNARVICASSKDLEKLVWEKSFRADLFHRINVVQLNLPPLRERRDDIPMMTEYFRHQYTKQFRKSAEPIDTPILDYLKGLQWPGNVRELGNYVARYVVVGPDALVEYSPTKKRVLKVAKDTTNEERVPLKRVAREAIHELERSVILEALKANRWNRRKTAETLQVSYRTLIYKIRDAGLAYPRRRANRAAEGRAPEGAGQGNAGVGPEPNDPPDTKLA